MSAKLEDGNVRAAIRLLMSEDSPAAPSPQSLSALREKHLPSSSVLTDLPAPQPQQCLSVDKSEVRRHVLSFPAGSAGGPDGLRPQHIRDLLTYPEAGPEFLSALMAFVNLVLAAQCPLNVAPVFFGGHLLWCSINCHRLLLETVGIQMCQFFWHKSTTVLLLSSPTGPQCGWWV